MKTQLLPPSRRIRTPHNTVPSFALALAMHALLFGSMYYVVQWKTQDLPPVVAELWASPPQPRVEVAPAPPPPPAPPPRVEPQPEPPKPDADIVTKEEKKPPPKVEPPKVEEKPPPKKAEPPKKDAIADLLKKQEEKARAEREQIRQAEAARIEQQMNQDRTLAGTPQAGGPLTGTPSPGTGTARNADYITRLAALIKSRIVYAVPEGTSTSVYADVEVDLLPTGEVTGVRIVKPSGLPGYDEAIERAIRRTDPFPRKPDGTVDRTIPFRFFPVERQG
ncbi:MAG TPA: TonB family protein [Burkholderiaceae bacterium]|nr:TonB family protein [Burkholderiaceae bacterium]